MFAALSLKRLATGEPEEKPSDADVERWAKNLADEEHREMTDRDIQNAREFLEYFPEALAAEGNRAKPKGKQAEFRRIYGRVNRKQNQNGGDNARKQPGET